MLKEISMEDMDTSEEGGGDPFLVEFRNWQVINTCSLLLVFFKQAEPLPFPRLRNTANENFVINMNKFFICYW